MKKKTRKETQELLLSRLSLVAPGAKSMENFCDTVYNILGIFSNVLGRKLYWK